MDNWDDYRVILALSRAGTLRKAASDLGTTHTTVARRIEAMRNRHGAELVERAGSVIRLTPLGEGLAIQAAEMEKAVFAAKRADAMRQGLSGPITLSMPDVITQYLLLDEITNFAAKNPGIELTVRSSYAFADMDRLEADVVIRNAMEPPDHLVGRRLYPNYVSYYARKDYLENTPLSDLKWIAPADGGTWPDWLESSPFPDAPIACRIDDIAARHRAVLAGLGLGRGACFMADTESELVRLTAADPVRQADFWVLTHPDMKDVPRIRLLMRFLSEAMQRKMALVEGRTLDPQRIWISSEKSAG